MGLRAQLSQVLCLQLGRLQEKCPFQPPQKSPCQRQPLPGPLASRGSELSPPRTAGVSPNTPFIHWAERGPGLESVGPGQP